LTKSGQHWTDFDQMLWSIGDLGLLLKVKHEGIGMTLTKSGQHWTDFDQMQGGTPIWGMADPQSDTGGLGGVLPCPKQVTLG
jgi:hypothetical protein